MSKFRGPHGEYIGPPSAMHGRHVGAWLCEVFGLDPQQVAHITLDCPLDNTATITVVFVRQGVTPETAEARIKTRRFTLSEVEYPTEAEGAA